LQERKNKIKENKGEKSKTVDMNILQDNPTVQVNANESQNCSTLKY
jgi:hypothetical protein